MQASRMFLFLVQVSSITPVLVSIQATRGLLQHPVSLSLQAMATALHFAPVPSLSLTNIQIHSTTSKALPSSSPK